MARVLVNTIKESEVFNFKPDSVTIKTANYTIPAGKYARITPLPLPDSTNYAQSTSNANLTITNRGLSLNSTQFYYYPAAGRLLQSSATEYYITFPIAQEMEVLLSLGSGATYNTATIDSVIFNVGINPFGSNSNATFFGRVFGIRLSAGTAEFVCSSKGFGSTTPFFVKAGDIIGVTGAGRFMVEEYNDIP